MMADKFDVDAINANTSLVDLVSRYVELKPKGREYVALCPFHEDTKPSFTVYEKRGKWRAKCFPCGESHDAISFLCAIEGVSFIDACKRLTSGELPDAQPIAAALLKKAPKRTTSKPPANCQLPPFPLKDGGEPVSTHPYLDANNELLGFAAYYRGNDEATYWTWGQYAESDVPRWERKQFTALRPLYGLEQLSRKPATAQIVICEGERVADAAAVLFQNLPVLTWAAGAFSYEQADWSPIAGRNVVLIPVADDAGRQTMERLAVCLYAAGVNQVKGVDVETQPDDSETPKGWDLFAAVDWTPEIALEWARARINIYPKDAPKPPEPDLPRQDGPTATVIPIRPDTGVSGNRGVADDASPDGNTVRKRAIEPEAELPPAFSEFGLCNRFTEEVGEDWRFTPEWGIWHKWNGSAWDRDIRKSIIPTIGKCVNGARAEARGLTEAQSNRICSYKMVRSIESLVASQPDIAMLADQWDDDPWQLGTPGGVVDLRTGALHPVSRDAYVSRYTAVTPEAGPTPLFDGVLSRASRGDEDLAAYLWRSFGYILTGSCREEAFFFYHGSAASGKSTLTNVLATIMGTYARSCKPSMFEESKHEGHPTELAELAGARLAYASESSEGARFNESRIKWLTGGDTISARFMRADNFTFKPTHKIIIHGNHMPSLKSSDEAMRRRIHLIEFPGSIPESQRDSNLKEKLIAEYPAILHRMIQGCLDWQANGLRKPAHVERATDEYMQAEDTLGAWLDDCCELASAGRANGADAYRSFKRWSEQAGEYVPSQKRFTQKLVDRGFSNNRTSKSRYFMGFSLKAHDIDQGPGSYGYD